jgi:hypothetical protein
VYKRYVGLEHHVLTCRICGRRIVPRYWSRICDGCWPAYEKARHELANARWRARRKLKRTLRILQGRTDDS